MSIWYCVGLEKNPGGSEGKAENMGSRNKFVINQLLDCNLVFELKNEQKPNLKHPRSTTFDKLTRMGL